MVGWHHWLNGHEFEQTLGDGEGTGKPVMQQFMRSQKVRHNLVTEQHEMLKIDKMRTDSSWELTISHMYLQIHGWCLCQSTLPKASHVPGADRGSEDSLSAKQWSLPSSGFKQAPVRDPGSLGQGPEPLRCLSAILTLQGWYKEWRRWCIKGNRPTVWAS